MCCEFAGVYFKVQRVGRFAIVHDIAAVFITNTFRLLHSCHISHRVYFGNFDTDSEKRDIERKKI